MDKHCKTSVDETVNLAMIIRNSSGVSRKTVLLVINYCTNYRILYKIMVINHKLHHMASEFLSWFNLKMSRKPESGKSLSSWFIKIN